MLALTLRVIFNLFNSMKEHLKVQLEVFFTSAHLCIADSRIAVRKCALCVGLCM